MTALPAKLAPRTSMLELAKLAREHTGVAIATLVEICRNPREKANARAYAANSLLDRGWGKAQMYVKIEGPDSEQDKGTEIRNMLESAAVSAIEMMRRRVPLPDKGDALIEQNQTVSNSESIPIATPITDNV